MGSTMRSETLAIPEVVAAALSRQSEAISSVARRIRETAPKGLVTIARGTSDHAADYAIRLTARELGLIGTSLPPSLVTLGPRPLDFQGQLVIAISQSGRSPDVVEPVAAARSGGALTLALVNDETSPLAQAAEHVLAIDAGAELAVAATKSYVASLVQVARLVAVWADNDALRRAIDALPERLDAATRVDWSAALQALEPATSLFVVGRGVGSATAREAALKLKEVAGLHAEAMSGAEIMHGPKALLHSTSPLLMFVGADVPEAASGATVDELASLTSGLLVAGPVPVAEGSPLPVPAAPDPALQPMLDIVPFYLMAEALSRRRGLSPDRPRNLKKVTETR